MVVPLVPLMTTVPLSFIVPSILPFIIRVPLTVKSVPMLRMLTGMPLLDDATVSVPSTVTSPELTSLALP